MLSLYFLALTLLGGFFALFVIAGWTSYNDGKLPGKTTLFRWFLAGLTASGLSSYVWLFGAGGNPASILEKVGDVLEVKEIMEKLALPVSGPVSVSEPTTVEKPAEITIGMPRF